MVFDPVIIKNLKEYVSSNCVVFNMRRYFLVF